MPTSAGTRTPPAPPGAAAKNSGTPGSGGLWLGAEDYLSELVQAAILALFGWKVVSDLDDMHLAPV